MKWFQIDEKGNTHDVPDLQTKDGVPIHLYNFSNVLRPRGGKLQKESLSLTIYEKLQSYFESWTNQKYGDSRPTKVVIAQLRENLLEETTTAYDRFLESLIQHNQIQLEERPNEINRSDEETKSN
jgi:hypothetical protein